MHWPTTLLNAAGSLLMLASAYAQSHDLKPYPPAPSGMQRWVIRLPPVATPEDHRVEVTVGKTIEVDCNRHLFSATVSRETAQGWGLPYYVVGELKGPATTSTLRVDAWDGAGWHESYATFPVADDHAYRGLGTVVADYYGGTRAIRRVTIVHEPPSGALTVRKDHAWSTDWKVFQRNGQGVAAVPVRFSYRLVEPGRVQARVVASRTAPLFRFHLR